MNQTIDRSSRYLYCMHWRQLIGLYAITLFMLVFGLGLLQSLVLGIEGDVHFDFSPFYVTNIMYTTATFLFLRMAFFRFYPGRAYVKLALACMLIFVGHIGMRYVLEEVLFQWVFGYSNYFDEVTFIYYISDNIGYAAYDMFIGILLFFLEYNLLRKKHIAFLETKHREAEAAFLQSQFSPHFLFNSLNNIYALMQDDTHAAGTAMIKLADLMRAITHEKDPLIPLSRELQYCRDYLDLQSLRFDHRIPVQIEADEATLKTLVPPFMLVGCIENACKHGELRDGSSPIQLLVARKPEGILILVQNRIGHHQKDTTGGVGLQNMRDRLQALFTNSHTLHISNENNEFRISLLLQNAH